MSDIPYSVRDKNIRVNAIKGFNFADIDTNEMFKKVDENNVGGTNILSTQTSTVNKLRMLVGSGIAKVSTGVLEGISTLANRTLHINVTGIPARGISILDNGETSRVGIGVIAPEEDLQVDGNIQIDGANNPRLKYQRTGGTPHALSEIGSELDGTNGGDLQFSTKVVGGSVTEKLRINNVGAIGIAGATYGNVGAVLTSNGPSAAVSWNRPYFMKAYLAVNIGANPTPTGTKRVLGMVENDWGASFGGATNDWSETNDVWTCPQTGIYRITLQIIIVSSNDNITFALGTVSRNGTLILRSENYLGGSTTEELERATVNATGIFGITADQTIQLDFGLITKFNNYTTTQLQGVRPTTASGAPILGDSTFLLIERIL